MGIRTMTVITVLLVLSAGRGRAQKFYFKDVSKLSGFTNAKGIHQDGNLALCRDRSGNLWGIFGHTAKGELKVWKGASADRMHYRYDAALNFKLGAAGLAFDNIPYPDGPKSRGQIWPLGLYIDSNDTFYCYIHNETGWYAGGTGYTINEQFEGEPDFRHIGLMTSIDHGHTWNFDGWIITAQEKSYSTRYLPDPQLKGGQEGPEYALGAGDCSLFENPNDEYLYLFYTKIYTKNGTFTDSTCVARALKKSPGTWNKWYNGAWTQPANNGLESPIYGHQGYGPSVAWSRYLKKYIIVSSYRAGWDPKGKCSLQLSVCSDWENQQWTPPELLDACKGDTLIVPSVYLTITNTYTSGNIKVVGKTFSIFHNLWANDIKRVEVTTRKM
ncbi:hypothetical protein SAMN04487894_10834 [Niabella drilacis]|uniref:DUF4185 domain-containing protein n=2 Tax=Niabella drilacis (strain DSM 25811 / CCM 8410 / CCUG 62505 / LMG 26954 / E90) TaxID=1285928 RepID=A0A1G6TW82_NIADE|nr:hypothetical protein SAMN04487894_10834 [Niabella drilacis]